MKRFILSVLAILAIVPAFLLSGCTTRLGDFTIVSTKNYERNVEYRNVGRMEGKDKVLIILGIPLGSPTIEDAVDDAIEAGGGVYLANAVIRQGSWFILLIGQTGYTVEGDVYAPVSHGDVLKEGEETFTLVDTPQGPVMKSTKTGDDIPVQDITHLLVDSN